MSVKVFVDTNILVYAQNNLEKHKQKVSRETLLSLSKKDQFGYFYTGYSSMNMQMIQQNMPTFPKSY